MGDSDVGDLNGGDHFKILMTKKYVGDVQILSPTHLVSNICHQHRCNPSHVSNHVSYSVNVYDPFHMWRLKVADVRSKMMLLPRKRI